MNLVENKKIKYNGDYDKLFEKNKQYHCIED
jgi:hypothetical protein